MAERFTILSTLPQNLYVEGSPVLIAAGNLLKDNQTGRVLAQIKLQSLSNAVIKAATVAVRPLDTTGKPLGETITQEYLDLSVNRGEDFGQKIAIPLPNASTRGMTVAVTRVVFSNNKEWVAEEQVWESLPAPTAFEEKLGNEEFIKQYQLTFGEQAQYCPQEYKDLWCCVCGTWNRGTVCGVCGSDKAELFDLEALTEAMNMRLAEEERLAAEEAARQEEARKAARKRNNIIGIVAGVVLAAVGAFFLATKVILPSISYNDAIALMEAGQYNEAIAVFTELGGFKDSLAQIENCETAIVTTINNQKYDAATDLYIAGKYEEAIAAFTALNGYKDSKAKVEEVKQEYHNHLLSTAHIGSTVYFGIYEQDNNTFTGKEEIEWIVVDKQGDMILLISKYALDSQPFNTTDTNVTWENCSLRHWLNETFINTAFNMDEQNRIISSTVTADMNPDYSTPPGDETTDKIFLLSISEISRYYSSGNACKCQGTDYCYSQGTDRSIDNNCEWWLRSPGGLSDHAAIITNNGLVSSYGSYVNSSKYAVRPALWIQLV